MNGLVRDAPSGYALCFERSATKRCGSARNLYSGDKFPAALFSRKLHPNFRSFRKVFVEVKPHFCVGTTRFFAALHVSCFDL